jgi:hypothetical protein
MDDMRHFLTPEIISSFYEKAVEFGTTDRIYCSNPTCSTFLYPVNIKGDKGECPVCSVETCTICKGASHTGDCPASTGSSQWRGLEAMFEMQGCGRAWYWLQPYYVSGCTSMTALMCILIVCLDVVAKLNVSTLHHGPVHSPKSTSDSLLYQLSMSYANQFFRVLCLRRSMEDLRVSRVD